MEARLLASELLGKFGVFWYQLDAEIEAFQLHSVTMTYGAGAVATGKSECRTVVLTMIRVIWRDISKVRVEAEMEYG